MSRQPLLFGIAAAALTAVAFTAGVAADRYWLATAEFGPPVLLSPVDGESVRNGEPQNNHPLTLDFRWSKVPGADQYDLYVIGPGAADPYISTQLVDTSYRYVYPGARFEEPRLKGWRWKVRSQVRGNWSAWSDFHNFDLRDSGLPREEAYPSKEDVLAYLDGKSIRPPEIAKIERTLDLKKENIEELEVGQSVIVVGGEPGTTPVRFVAVIDGDRYAIEIFVSHRQLNAKRVFYGIAVERVAKQ